MPRYCDTCGQSHGRIHLPDTMNPSTPFEWAATFAGGLMLVIFWVAVVVLGLAMAAPR